MKRIARETWHKLAELWSAGGLDCRKQQEELTTSACWWEESLGSDFLQMLGNSSWRLPEQMTFRCDFIRCFATTLIRTDHPEHDLIWGSYQIRDKRCGWYFHTNEIQLKNCNLRKALKPNPKCLLTLSVWSAQLFQWDVSMFDLLKDYHSCLLSDLIRWVTLGT